MALGIAFSIKADLGTSPISSVPYVVSLVTPLTVGIATIIMHCFFVLFQLIILRKDFKLVQLLQLPIAFLFGFMTDFAVWLLQSVEYSSYAVQWVLCCAGIVLIGVGVRMQVTANVIFLAGEGLIMALCKVTHLKFGNMKIMFDIMLVASAVTIGFATRGELLGVQEGTVAAALLVGQLTKIVANPIKKLAKLFIGTQEEQKQKQVKFKPADEKAFIGAEDHSQI